MKAWETFKEYFMITVGVAIVAVSVYFLLVPSHVTVGSISGLSIILEYFIPLPLSVITFILNAILLVVGFLLIGKDFGLKTVSDDASDDGSPGADLSGCTVDHEGSVSGYDRVYFHCKHWTGGDVPL